MLHSKNHLFYKYIIYMQFTTHNFLTIYHTNLRNIGLFITIALAANNFQYKTKFMKKIGMIMIPFIFLLISLILNVELLYLVNEHRENKENKKTLDFIPYLTMTLLIVLMIKTIYNFIYI